MTTMPPLLTFFLLLATHDVTSFAVNDDVTTSPYDLDVCSVERCTFNESGSVLDCADLGCTPEWEAINSTSSGDGDQPPRLQQVLAAEHLLLSGNHLTFLMSLKPFGASLCTVDASHNDISSIASDAFFLSDGLTDLDLSANKLTIDAFRSPTSTTLFGLVNLRRLDVSNNELGELSERDMFSSVRTTLEWLDLSANRISTLVNNTLADLVVLESLDLSHNHIRSLARDSFLGLSRLRRLDLSDNRLEGLPDELFAQCGRLESIDLRRNSIRNVSSEAFLGLHSLVELHLDDNELPNGIPATLPPSLQVLTLDGSAGMTTVSDRTLIIDEAIGRSPSSLKYISIRRCPLLTSVGAGAFGLLKRLATVQLTDNPKLTAVDVGAFNEAINNNDRKLFGLHTERSLMIVLNLSGNAMSRLDEKLVNWSALESFDLSGNAWICDCRMEWIHGLHADNSSLDTFVCHWPIHLRGHSFTSGVVRSTTLSCNLTFVYRYQCGLGFLVLVTVLFISASVGLFVCWRHSLAPRCFDQDVDYHTLYDASQSMVSLNHGNHGAGAAVETTIGVGSAAYDEDDDFDETTIVVRPLRPVQRTIEFGNVRGSARYHSKKKKQKKKTRTDER